MVRSIAVALLLGLLLMVVPATARADPLPPGGQRPALAAEFQGAEQSRLSLVARYDPRDLKFYTESGSAWTPTGWKRSAQGAISDMLAAIEGMLGQIVVLMVRLLDLAWNVNLTRALMPVISSISTRFSGLVWGFGGTLLVMVAAWIVVQVANGAYARLTTGVGAVLLVVCLGFLTYDGLGGVVASAEDLSTELSARILTPSDDASLDEAITTMTDAIYYQLILEQWARANFKDLDTALIYSSPDNVAGGQFWNLSDEKADAKWKEFSQEPRSKDALLPWHDNPIGRRLGVVFDTFLGILFVVPFLALFGILVVGAKGLTFVLACLWPVAVFFAAMPWFRGPAFLRGYVVWACVSPILKTLSAFALAVVMAFTGGLIDATPYIPGGWATVTLFIGAFTFVAYLMARPFGRMLRGMVFKSVAEEASEARAAHVAREIAATEYRSMRAAALVSNGSGQQMLMAWSTTQMRALQFREAAALTVGAGGSQQRQGQTGRRISAMQAYGTVQDFRPRPRHTSQNHLPGVPEYGLPELMREARRMVEAVARVAVNGGGGGRR